MRRWDYTQASRRLPQYATNPPAAPSAEPTLPFDRDDLVGRAVATGDEHAIKFTEACLREHTLAAAQAHVTLTSGPANCQRWATGEEA